MHQQVVLCPSFDHDLAAVAAMHTTYHKISARERDTAPRYYYKRTRSYSFCQRVRHGIRRVLAFLFTQVGVCCLIGAYMVLGAFLFAAIESKSQMQEAYIALQMRKQFSKELWNVTYHTNVLHRGPWRESADRMVKTFQADTLANIRKGYTGTEPGVKIWTFSSALMYSLTIFTTIGKDYDIVLYFLQCVKKSP